LKESSDGETLTAVGIMAYGSRFVEQWRKKRDVQRRFLSGEHSGETDWRNELKGWIGGKIMRL